jgi:ATP synthase I chain
MAGDSEYVAIERRIERAIAAAGFAAALGAGIGWGVRAGVGTAIGAALCWLNFHWLRQGAAGVIALGMAQAGAEKVNVPKTTHAKFFGRLALLLLAVYVILAWLKLPAVAVLCGLGVVLPAVIFELGYEVTRGHHRWNA